jgi:glycosyltransferase involved in cell wall biosynthesis
MLHSIASQTLQPACVLVVDDGSTDNTIDAVNDHAELFPPGVLWHVTAKVGDGSSGNPARNIGLRELAEYPYLCFLDSDDAIEPKYLERLVRELESDATSAVAYPRLQLCGLAKNSWGNEYADSDLGRRNTAPACGVIRTDALLQVGGWPILDRNQDGTKPADDWALWRRLRGLGWRMTYVPEAELFYRRHAESMWRTGGRANTQTHWSRGVDQSYDFVTLAIPFSGRRHTQLLNAIKSQTFPANRIHALFLDNSGAQEFGDSLKRWLAKQDFASISYHRDNRQAVEGMPSADLADCEIDESRFCKKIHGAEINHHVAGLWNRLGQLARTDLVWCVEDDVIPPPHALEQLIGDMDMQADAVTAAYPSRVTPGKFCAWEYDPWRLLDRGVGLARIGGCGFGCVLARRSVFDRPAHSQGDHAGYDLNLWADVNRQGGVVKVDWNVLCEHKGAL